MTTTTQEALVAEHPVVMVAASAALGALLGIGGVALVADSGPASEPPAAAAKYSS
ncbi:MAG: hypothetical protein M3419_06380 [Actinomycetota bacterium]|nr:hypothetical protein [Actinomycetota bacterium]